MQLGEEKISFLLTRFSKDEMFRGAFLSSVFNQTIFTMSLCAGGFSKVLLFSW